MREADPIEPLDAELWEAPRRLSFDDACEQMGLDRSPAGRRDPHCREDDTSW
jgi:hypothetical protein